MGKPNFVAGFDSGSAMLLATSAFLRGEPFPAVGQPPALEPALKATRRLPRALREKLFIFGGAAETVSPRRMKRIDADDLCRWVADEYPDRRYPVVAVGSASGALVHLSAALGMPWLPQTFLIPVRGRVHPDDPRSALELGVRPGGELLEANPDWQLHHMHDANQDRLMVRALTYFRVKRRRLGPAYERFLRRRLEPGGTILVTECTRSWRTTRIGDRHVFQHGAVGGATEQEFQHGGPRVADYLRRYDSPVRRWDGPEPDTEMPEAEWGFAGELADDVRRFADEHGYRVRRLVFDEPDAISPLVADLYRWWYRRRNVPANRLFVESFVLLEPYWALRTGSVPYWMVFNMRPSLDAALDFLDGRPPFDEILLALFQHGVEAVGLPRVEQWKEVLHRARRGGRFAAMAADDFPWDLGHYATYDDALRRVPARYPAPGPLTLPEFDGFLAGAGEYPGVRWHG